MRNSIIKDNNILVVDGTNLIHRNYFVHSDRKTKEGIYTGGLFGTIRSLKSYESNFKPKQIFVCFDKSSDTFRKELYPEYKGTRKETEKELKSQFELLRIFCELANIPFIEMDKYEADDIIGSLCCNAGEYSLNPYAVTGDKDILQLIDKDVDILYLSNKGPIIYTEEQFISEYEIQPSQFIDYKALVGDTSDNIPGIKGVGKKTAAKLLGEYGSLDGIYENIEELKGKQKERIVEGKDMAYLSKVLSEIKCEIDLSYDEYFRRYVTEGFDLSSDVVQGFLDELEIK